MISDRLGTMLGNEWMDVFAQHCWDGMIAAREGRMKRLRKSVDSAGGWKLPATMHVMQPLKHCLKGLVK